MNARAFHTRLQTLELEGLVVMERLLGARAEPMIFLYGRGALLAVLSDPEGGVWTYSAREGLCRQD